MSGGGAGAGRHPLSGGGAFRGPGGDAAVRRTNDDAAGARAGCAARGYLEDPFVGRFVRGRPAPRPPAMNRGSWARTQAVRQVLQSFLARAHGGAAGEGSGESQVVVLGAGFDTSFFNLRLPPGSRWFEVDMEEVVRRKAAVLQRSPDMLAMMGGPGGEGGADIDLERGTVRGSAYGLAVADLRDLAGLESALQNLGVRREPPTLVLLECVLAYLPPEAGQELCRWAAAAFPAGAIVIYEMTGMDEFGRQLLANLRARGCALPGFEGCPDLLAQRERLASSGFESVTAWDMDRVYHHFLEPEERRRVERLEFLDELEEWSLINRHYCCATAIVDKAGVGLARLLLPGTVHGKADAKPAADRE